MPQGQTTFPWELASLVKPFIKPLLWPFFLPPCLCGSTRKAPFHSHKIVVFGSLHVLLQGPCSASAPFACLPSP